MEECIQMYTFQESAWKNLIKFTDKPITKIIYNQFDIKLGQFTQEELGAVLMKIKKKQESNRS